VLGSLAVGDRFDLAGFAVPLVLLRNSGLVQSSVKGIDTRRIETAFSVCDPEKECEIRLGGETYLSVPLLSGALEDAVAHGYSLRTLQSVDAGAAPLLGALRSLFIAAGAALLMSAFVLSVLSSRSIVRPISKIVQHLRATEETGVLPEFRADASRIHEIRQLAERFNDAAAAVRDGRESLVRAYVEFTGSLASALDARDTYTAGHSRRVSDYACAIAHKMNLPDNEIEVIRIGALLHDIGKIGIPDALLLKPGKLSPSEMAALREHPVIGRHILEGVQGFQNYLDIVELHHENWNGAGYPHGLKAEEIPLSARIVKVADTYDAMTSDRPYRPGMSHEQALQEFRLITGIHVDPAVMAAFEAVWLDENKDAAQTPRLDSINLLHNLDWALRNQNVFENIPAAPPFETVPLDKTDREEEPPQVLPMELLKTRSREESGTPDPALALRSDTMDRPQEPSAHTNNALSTLERAVRLKAAFDNLAPAPAMPVTLQTVNDQLKARGYKAQLKDGHDYFYFSSGETVDWLDRTVRVPTVSSLSHKEWLDEFERMKKLNRSVVSSASSKPA